MIKMLILADGTELDVVHEYSVSPVEFRGTIGTADYNSLAEISTKLTPDNLAKIEYYGVSDTDDSDQTLLRTFTEMTVDSEPKFAITERGNYIEAGIIIRKLTTKEKQQKKILELINTLSDEDALLFKTMYPTFDDLNGATVPENTKFVYNGLLYKTTEDLVVDALTGLQLDESGEADGMFKCIDEIHTGTYEDPIEYNEYVMLEAGKFYKQCDIEYFCLQSPGRLITEDLWDCVDLWVREPEEMDIYPNYPSDTIFLWNDEVKPWPQGVFTLYDGSIYLAANENVDTAPSAEDTDNWEFVTKAKPGEEGTVYVKEEQQPEPEPEQPATPETPSESTDSSTEENPDTSDNTDSSETDNSGTEENPDTTDTTGETDNTDSSETDNSGTEETPDASDNTDSSIGDMSDPSIGIVGDATTYGPDGSEVSTDSSSETTDNTVTGDTTTETSSEEVPE